MSEKKSTDEASNERRTSGDDTKAAPFVEVRTTMPGATGTASSSTSSPAGVALALDAGFEVVSVKVAGKELNAAARERFIAGFKAARADMAVAGAGTNNDAIQQALRNMPGLLGRVGMLPTPMQRPGGDKLKHEVDVQVSIPAPKKLPQPDGVCVACGVSFYASRPPENNVVKGVTIVEGDVPVLTMDGERMVRGFVYVAAGAAHDHANVGEIQPHGIVGMPPSPHQLIFTGMARRRDQLTREAAGLPPKGGRLAALVDGRLPDPAQGPFVVRVWSVDDDGVERFAFVGPDGGADEVFRGRHPRYDNRQLVAKSSGRELFDHVMDAVEWSARHEEPNVCTPMSLAEAELCIEWQRDQLVDLVKPNAAAAAEVVQVSSPEARRWRYVGPKFEFDNQTLEPGILVTEIGDGLTKRAMLVVADDGVKWTVARANLQPATKPWGQLVEETAPGLAAWKDTDTNGDGDSFNESMRRKNGLPLPPAEELRRQLDVEIARYTGPTVSRPALPPLRSMEALSTGDLVEIRKNDARFPVVKVRPLSADVRDGSAARLWIVDRDNIALVSQRMRYKGPPVWGYYANLVDDMVVELNIKVLPHVGISVCDPSNGVATWVVDADRLVDIDEAPAASPEERAKMVEWWEKNTSKPEHGEKVRLCGVKLDPAWRYFVSGKGSLCRKRLAEVPGEASPAPETLIREAVTREAGFHYFVDVDGDIARSPRQRLDDDAVVKLAEEIPATAQRQRDAERGLELEAERRGRRRSLLGALVQAARQIKGVKRSDVALELGVTEADIDVIEMGTRPMTVDQMAAFERMGLLPGCDLDTKWIVRENTKTGGGILRTYSGPAGERAMSPSSVAAPFPSFRAAETWAADFAPRGCAITTDEAALLVSSPNPTTTTTGDVFVIFDVENLRMADGRTGDDPKRYLWIGSFNDAAVWETRKAALEAQRAIDALRFHGNVVPLALAFREVSKASRTAMTLGDGIRAARRNKGLTIGDVARITGLSTSQVSSLELGLQRLGDDMHALFAFAGLLVTSARWRYTGTTIEAPWNASIGRSTQLPKGAEVMLAPDVMVQGPLVNVRADDGGIWTVLPQHLAVIDGAVEVLPSLPTEVLTGLAIEPASNKELDGTEYVEAVVQVGSREPGGARAEEVITTPVEMPPRVYLERAGSTMRQYRVRDRQSLREAAADAGFSTVRMGELERNAGEVMTLDEHDRLVTNGRLPKPTVGPFVIARPLNAPPGKALRFAWLFRGARDGLMFRQETNPLDVRTPFIDVGAAGDARVYPDEIVLTTEMAVRLAQSEERSTFLVNVRTNDGATTPVAVELYGSDLWAPVPLRIEKTSSADGLSTFDVTGPAEDVVSALQAFANTSPVGDADVPMIRADAEWQLLLDARSREVDELHERIAAMEKRQLHAVVVMRGLEDRLDEHTFAELLTAIEPSDAVCDDADELVELRETVKRGVAAFDDNQKQIVLLAFANLSIQRPGWNEILKEMAGQVMEGGAQVFAALQTTAASDPRVVDAETHRLRVFARKVREVAASGDVGDALTDALAELSSSSPVDPPASSVASSSERG